MLVFSSSRRTRYAIPATRSPTGQYVRTRRPWAAIAAQVLRVRAYCPVGDLVAGMAYLVRRLLENTSNDSFLQEQARGAAISELLAKPEPSTA